MKELLFLLEDGAITGLTGWGYAALWLTVSIVVYSLCLLYIAWQDGEVTGDEVVGGAVAVPIVLLLIAVAVYWWRVSLTIAAVSLLVGGLPYGAVRLGQYLHDR